MSDLALVSLLAAGTLLMRSSLVALLAGVTIPAYVAEALKLVAPAVMAGLLAQTLVLDGAAFRVTPSWYLAAVVAAFVAWRTRSIGLTLVIGMIAVWLLEALLP